MYKKISLFFLLASFSFSTHSSPIDSSEKKCSKETLVFNKKGEQVGTKIGGYCAGYLQGALEVLSETSREVCLNKNTDTTPNYLLSVYRSYVKEKGHNKTLQATLVSAYKRAFGC